MKSQAKLDLFRRVYLCVLAAYAVVREVLPLNFLIQSSLVSLAVFSIGFVIILWDMFSTQRILKSPYTDLLILFVFLCAVSCLVNIQYGVFDNIVCLGLMVLYFFLIYAYREENAEKTIKAVFISYAVVWAVFVIISLSMYLFDVDYAIIKVNGIPTNQGFSHEYMRLWGVFADANYGAVGSLAAIFISLYLLVKTRNAAGKVALTVNIVFEFIFVILSGSRTAKLTLAVVLVFGLFCWAVHLKKYKPAGRICIGALSMAAVALTTVALFSVVAKGLPLAKYSIQLGSNYNKAANAVHALFDKLYTVGGVEVTEGLQTYAGDQWETELTDYTAHAKLETLKRTDTGKEDISNGRFKRWRDGIEIFLQTPVIGTSPRNVIAFAQEHAPDTTIAKYNYSISNSFIEMFTYTGVLGGAAMLLFLLMAMLSILRYIIMNPVGMAEFSIMATAATFVCDAFFSPDLFFLFTVGGILFWYAVGIVVHRDSGREDKQFHHIAVLLEKILGR